MSFFRYLCGLAGWQIRTWAGKRAPLQSVIFILDQCNLRCKHCSVYAIAKPRIKTMQQIREDLEDCYRAGSRFVDFEGGELYLWKDGSRTINDVIDMAHDIGFHSATITTNAQLPFAGSHADQIWVSMDGIGEWHDAIRGEGTFRRLEDNIRDYAKWRQEESKRGRKTASVCVNMVINNRNYPCLQQTLDYVKQSPFIDKISVNFHTPFAETEDLFLPQEIRNNLIDFLIDCKRRGYPLMNTRSGLQAMKMDHGVTRCGNGSCWITNFIFSDGSRSPKCMGYTHHVCDRCGFSMGGEMYAIAHLKPDTILAGLSLRM